MKQPRWLWFPLLLLFLSACNTTLPPAADELATEAMATAPQVWFLPPIGEPVKGENFDPDLELELKIFNVNPADGLAYGAALGPNLSTAAGSIKVKAHKYHANWRVRETAANPAASDYVRVEVRRQGTLSGPACAEVGGDCLGFFDAYLVANKGHKARAGTPEGFIPVVRHHTLPIKFYVGKRADGPPPATLAELQQVSSAEPFDETLGNCAASEFDTPGQGLQAVGAGLQAVGAVGGLFAGPARNFVDRMVTPEEVAEQLSAIFAEFTPEAQVAVLVVDDFGGVYDLPPELFQDGVDLDALVASGALSHGALVFYQVLELLAGAGYTNPRRYFNGNTQEPFVKFRPQNAPHLLVQAVDTAGLNTDEMPQRIRASLNYLSGKLKFRHIVVNMSFAIVPCAVVNDLQQSGIVTFEDYVAALGVVNDVAEEYRAELTKLVTTPLELLAEPLFAYISCPLEGGTPEIPTCDGSSGSDDPVILSMVHIASAGNFGFGFPMYPAAWSTVISVSSQDVMGDGYSTEKSTFSNSGEVMVPGALFELSSADTTVAYAGTSFSAPVLSVFTALDLARGQLCNPGNVAVYPATAPALAHGTFSNTPLASAFGDAGSAIHEFCNAE